jgi:hypothetical protein
MRLSDRYKYMSKGDLREGALESASKPGTTRLDHYMASLLPAFDPARDCILPLVRRKDGSAAVFCPCCREYHHHGRWEDHEPGVPDGRVSHCDWRRSPLTHYFVVRPKQDKATKTAERCLREAGKDGLLRSKLLHFVSNVVRGFSAKELDEIINTLAAKEQISCEALPSTGGRRPILIKWIGG